MNFESITVVAVACFVLTVAYFLDSYRAKLFRKARPNALEDGRN